MNTKRTAIIVAFVAVAAVVGFVALRGNWPPGQGTEAAIGAANRYQSDQIAAGDVQLQDAEIQAFLQSDVFHKLATNPEFRNIVKEQSFRDVAADQAYQAIVANKDQASSLANKEFANYLVQPATVALVTSEAFSKVTSECNMSEVLRTPKFYELVASALESKPTVAEFRNLVVGASKELSQSFVEYASRNTEVVMAALQPALLEAKDVLLAQNGAAELLASPQIGTLLESKPFAELVTMEAHEELMKRPDIMSLAFSSEAFNKIVEAQQWSALERGFTTIEQ